MAETRIIDNATRPAGEELLASLARASDVRIATAFASESGITRIAPSLEKILDNGGEVGVVYGLDFHITTPGALEEFTKLATAYLGMSHCAYSDWGLALRHTFHPKIYICTSETGNAQVMVGSSNLTRAGLWDNVEANTIVTGHTADPVIADARDIFSRIAQAPTLFVPDAEYIEAYRAVHIRMSMLPLTPEPPEEIASDYERIKQLEFQLPATAIDGIGWTTDVLSCVRTMQQDGREFTLTEFRQRFEEGLRLRHPKNRHVNAKIRQQFQVLRKRKVLAFLDNRGRYRVIDEAPEASAQAP
ncbi:MAG: phospholipase D-like domain-containing protein [Chloroflexota bacterium]|nr:phospholipase D-like domain-containing protein [Chloroflexota bacterium]